MAVWTTAALACSMPIFAPSTPPAAATLGQLYTRAAQTVEAAQLQTGTPAPSASAMVASPTLSSVTSTRTAGVVALCDAAAFVRDVTIPDGTIVEPGRDFTKTWRLKNVGTCSWTTAYALVFVSWRPHAWRSERRPARQR